VASARNEAPKAPRGCGVGRGGMGEDIPFRRNVKVFELKMASFGAF